MLDLVFISILSMKNGAQISVPDIWVMRLKEEPLYIKKRPKIDDYLWALCNLSTVFRLFETLILILVLYFFCAKNASRF